MIESASADDRFQAMLAEFCAMVQIPKDDQASGVEFEADGHIVLVAPDPRDGERLLIDVRVMHLESRSAALLTALLQLNHESRLEHDWVASLDVFDDLHLHTQRDIRNCDASDLQTLLTEGIDRAEALQSLYQAMAAEPATAAGVHAATPAPDPVVTMRV